MKQSVTEMPASPPKKGTPPGAAAQPKPQGYERISDKVAKRLLDCLYRGEMKPGQRLPPEPSLAAEMGVGRATLREAICRLQDMGVMQSRRGSGVVALDYREHANLDFAVAVMCDGEPDTTTMLELVGFFETLIPTMARTIAVGISRVGVRELTLLDTINREQLAATDMEEILDLDNQWLSTLVDLNGNLLDRLLYNSVQPLLRMIRRRFFQTRAVDQHVKSRRSFVHYVAEKRPPVEELESTYRKLLQAMADILRESCQSTETEPSPPKTKPKAKRGGTKK